jgi:dTMP kinase
MRASERKGFFITFEKTVEGLGGTTQSHLLVEELRKRGYDAVWTRETGGTELGQKLRELYLDPARDISNAAELFIIMADRAQHYKEVLKPAIMAGKIVVCDRYVDSTTVYQGHGRGWRKAFLLRLHQATTGALMPDLTFVLTGESHRKVPNDDRFERLGDAFFKKINDGMLQLAQTDERFVKVVANRPMAVVTANLLDVTLKRLPGRFK